MDTPTILKFSHYLPTCLWRWNRQCVPKRRHIKFRRWGITHKKTHNKRSNWLQALDNDQLDAQFFKYTYYDPLHVHVSSNILLILGRSNCINIESDIVALSKWPSGAQVERELFFLNLCTGRSLTESDDTRCCINTIWPPEDKQDIARSMYM